MNHYRIISYRPSITRIKYTLIGNRIDSLYYQADHLEIIGQLGAFLDICSLRGLFDVTKLSGFEFTEYFTKNILKNGTVPCIMSQNVRDNEFDLTDCVKVTREVHKKLYRSILNCNDIALSYTGHYRRAAVVSSSNQEFHLGPNVCKLTRSNKSIDPYFYSTFLNSSYGQRSLEREKTISAQPTVNMDRIRSLPIPNVLYQSQKYVGDKVRQAERLREQAQTMYRTIRSILTLNDIQQAIATPDTQITRINAIDINPRLDAKYYRYRAIQVLKACQRNQGIHIAQLNPEISNGFEYRKFVDNGRAYITVSEVSTGRLDLSYAPHIPSNVNVPPKANLNSRCVLVVRTGSIGIAVKVYCEDEHACISSHLIRLAFESEETAAAVAAFLNSEMGKILLYKISYGAVQPQIGQDEILMLPIPKAIIDQGKKILSCLNLKENFIRSATRLTTAAKLLVEALIEGKVTESDLITAQEALERGDTGPDRAILARLTRKGIDVPGEPPLFPDLDALYKALNLDYKDQTTNKE